MHTGCRQRPGCRCAKSRSSIARPARRYGCARGRSSGELWIKASAAWGSRSRDAVPGRVRAMINAALIADGGAPAQAAFFEATRWAGAGQWGEIEQIASLRGGRALVNKTLSTYSPDQLLPINSEPPLRHFLKALGEPRASDPALATTTL